ncbi:ribonuclease domain-containing protein [Nocardia sp. NPDC052566]|uniref:ribonuclease domain-containing protein n=1 Tax=Nocardia sp. NPDC052566 TaxID=3364330 RepID=UPI0037C9DF74
MNLGPTGRMRTIATLGGVVFLLLVALIFLRDRGGDDKATSAVTTTARATSSALLAPPRTPDGPPRTGAPVARAPGVPDRAYATLTEIDAGRWPGSANAPGTQGGEQWMNRAGTLPRTDAAGKRVTYQEWDVNPKRRGQSRDAERIVTGSDGSAWYTGDHYETFTRMR